MLVKHLTTFVRSIGIRLLHYGVTLITLVAEPASESERSVYTPNSSQGGNSTLVCKTSSKTEMNVRRAGIIISYRPSAHRLPGVILRLSDYTYLFRRCNFFFSEIL